MLNIMYEDQYLSYFKQRENYSEQDYYEMDYDEYLDEFGNNGDLDVKDVKDLEEYLGNTNFYFEDNKYNYNEDIEGLKEETKLYLQFR